MDNAYAVFFKCYIYTLFNVGKTVLRYKNVVHVDIFFPKEKSLEVSYLELSHRAYLLNVLVLIFYSAPFQQVTLSVIYSFAKLL